MQKKIPQITSYATPSTLKAVAEMKEMIFELRKENIELRRLATLARNLSDKRKASVDKVHNRWRLEWNRRRKISLKYQAARKDLMVLSRYDRFFSQPLSRWADWQAPEKCEIMARAIISFKQYEDEGKIDYAAFLILIAGVQINPFRKDDIKRRFGVEVASNWTRTIKKYTALGYVHQIERRNLYFITDTGREFITEIIQAPMGRRMNNYYGGLFNELKVTKRDLPY
jgi:hypothetical protein